MEYKANIWNTTYYSDSRNPNLYEPNPIPNMEEFGFDKKNLDEYLKNKYQFIKPYGGLKRSLMYFGMEVGIGWYGILTKVMEEVLKELTPENIEKQPFLADFRFTQVKEKMGTLRISSDGTNEKISDILRWGEKRSETTCEVCGDLGILRDNGWYVCLCDKHQREWCETEENLQIMMEESFNKKP